jgi:hypothetical protein
VSSLPPDTASGQALATERGHDDDDGRHHHSKSDDDEDGGSAKSDSDLAIEALSNRADLVSGGDVLVRITLPRGHSATKAVLALNGEPLQNALHPAPDGRGYLARISGMKLGGNELTLSVPGEKVKLELTNHPRSGPVFSGPQIQPWTCLPGALDPQCNRATTYQYYYRPQTDNAFLPYDPANPATDVMQVTTTKGVSVPYIVRVERGTMDRDGFAFAVLFDPNKPWTPWTPQQGWNGSVHILQGGGCGTGFAEGPPASPLISSGLSKDALSKGFLVAQLALVNNAHNCNHVVGAEAVMMAKEHITENYGLINFTFGQGSSGGSISQYMESNAYPGLYDGLLVSATVFDTDLSRHHAWDCKLMWDHFATPGTIPFTFAQKEAVSGHFGSCNLHVTTGRYEVYNPSVGTECTVPADQKFNAVTNPGGVRCTLQDYQVNQVGRRPDGYANTRVNNVGVQYGLKALISGVVTGVGGNPLTPADTTKTYITPAQFVELNAGVGGRDINFNRVTTRVSADLAGLPRLYRTGTNNIGNNLDQVAMLELRNPMTDYHQAFQTNITRARLLQANGHYDNHVFWRTMRFGGDAILSAQFFDVMVEWLTAIKADRRKVSRAQKIIDNKPALARDRCTLGDGIDQDPSACPTDLPLARVLAGQDDSMHHGKCQLKQLLKSDYLPVVFSDAQWETLQKTFPGGVCDNDKPLVALQPTAPWLTYKEVIGGQPLPKAPTSSPVREKGERD